MMGDYLLLRVIVITLAFSSLISSAELLVTPSLEVKGSPGLKQEMTSLCQRLIFRGFSRSEHIYKYAHSLKLIVNASTAAETNYIHVCLHRNFSLAIGMCPHNQWEQVSNGSWIERISPFFENKFLDIRVAGSSKVTLKVSNVREWFLFRYVFLILGSVLLTFASTLSRSYAFYYAASFSVGMVLVGLLILFQLVKHLPTAGSRSGLFFYPFLLGLCCVIYPYIPTFSQSMLRDMGFKLGIDKIVISAWVHCLHLLGAIWGFFAIRSQLLLTQDGSIDTSISLFISWTIWISAAVLILLSSGDAILAWGALIFVTVMSRILRTFTG